MIKPIRQLPIDYRYALGENKIYADEQYNTLNKEIYYPNLYVLIIRGESAPIACCLSEYNPLGLGFITPGISKAKVLLIFGSSNWIIKHPPLQRDLINQQQKEKRRQKKREISWYLWWWMG